MCGICGQFNYKDFAPISSESIREMNNTIAHRGPDDEGIFISGPVGFGFRRLSIIDLEGGHQPMSDNEKSIWIVFNGEIYNFKELRTELENFGHRFRTSCDTEVIIYGYKQWGENVFEHLMGMFGLAIWDVREKKMILARDAMGIKLVYYMINSKSVYFGSEIRSINTTIRNKPKVDALSLNLFLKYRYTPSPLTIFQGIKKLAPGTMLVFRKGRYEKKRWYKFRPKPLNPMPNLREAEEELLAIYKKAVKRHLISDVPVGLLLSGGVDSGLLLGLMKLYGNSWPTYTVGYGANFKDDELTYAATTAEIFSSKNVGIKLSIDTFEKHLNTIIKCLEEPVATSSIVPMYFVCKRASKDLKVALVGQGPDELFGGYKRHLGIRYGSYWRKTPQFLRNNIKHLIKKMPRNETLKRGLYSLDISDRLKRYIETFSIMDSNTIDNLFIEGLLPIGSENYIDEIWLELKEMMNGTDELGGLQFIELRSALPDELLMYADKLSMAHGLEIRVPYLDRELVEYVECIGESFKVRYGIRKWLHKKVCRDFLPREIIKRKKRGFGMNVVDDWFHSSMSKKMDDLLLDSESLMYEYLRHQKVQKLLLDHKARKNNNYKILFSLIVFENWLRSYC